MTNFEIVARSIPVPTYIERQIYKSYRKLQKIHSKMTNCKVTIAAAKQQSLKSKIYDVKIAINMSGKQLISKKQNQYLFTAIKESFSSAQTILEKQFKNFYYYDRKLMKHNNRFAHEAAHIN